MFPALQPIGLTALELFNFGRELGETHGFTLKDGLVRNAFREAHNIKLDCSGAQRDGFLIRRGYGSEIRVNGSALENMNRTEERSYFAVMHSLLHADRNAPFEVTYESMKDETFKLCNRQAYWATVGLCLPPEVVNDLRYPLASEDVSERLSNMAIANVSFLLLKAGAAFYNSFPELLDSASPSGMAP